MIWNRFQRRNRSLCCSDHFFSMLNTSPPQFSREWLLQPDPIYKTPEPFRYHVPKLYDRLDDLLFVCHWSLVVRGKWSFRKWVNYRPAEEPKRKRTRPSFVRYDNFKCPHPHAVWRMTNGGTVKRIVNIYYSEIVDGEIVGVEVKFWSAAISLKRKNGNKIRV